MENKKQILKYIASLTMFMAFLFPSAFQFVHAFEKHEIEICTDTTSHYHKTTTDCDLCDFNLNHSSHDFSTFENSVVISKPVKPNVIFTTLVFTSSLKSTKSLRAPPINS